MTALRNSTDLLPNETGKNYFLKKQPFKASLLLGIYSRETKTYIHTETCTQMFIAIHSIIHNSEKLGKKTSIYTNEWMDEQNFV